MCKGAEKLGRAINPGRAELFLVFCQLMELQLPSFPLSLFFLGALILLVKRLRSKSKLPPPTDLPPGPPKFPVIGNLHNLSGKLPHHALRDLSRVHGPVMMLRLGQVNMAVISSSEAAQEILKAHDANFVFRPDLVAAKIIGYGCTDIAFSSGEHWRQLRKICVMELLSAKRVKSFAALRSEEIFTFLRDIAAAGPAGEAVNLHPRLLGLTNAIVCRASFGHRCSGQKEFLAGIRKCIVLGSGFILGDLFPSFGFVDAFTGLTSELRKIHRELDKILDRTIQEHYELTRKADEAEDLIDVLLRLKDQGGMDLPITYENIKAVIVDMFTAGTETSATTIEWAMSELMRHPGKMEKAQREVRDAVKGKDIVEESDVAGLIYIRAIVKETLRLHSPVPLLLPRVSKNTCRILGYTVPADARVAVNVWAISRDPQHWSDPESFKPERFEEGEATADFKGNNFEFLPFGGGRRICPGMMFGLANVELALARLLFYFDWKLPEGMKPQDVDMTEIFGTTTRRKQELQLVASPRYPLPPPAA